MPAVILSGDLVSAFGNVINSTTATVNHENLISTPKKSVHKYKKGEIIVS